MRINAITIEVVFDLFVILYIITSFCVRIMSSVGSQYSLLNNWTKFSNVLTSKINLAHLFFILNNRCSCSFEQIRHTVYSYSRIGFISEFYNKTEITLSSILCRHIMEFNLKDESPVDALRTCIFIYLPYILKTLSSFGENNIMNTKLCMSSHNKRVIILIYTKDCSDTEGYKTKRTSWPKTFCIALSRHSSFKNRSINLFYPCSSNCCSIRRSSSCFASSSWESPIDSSIVSLLTWCIFCLVPIYKQNDAWFVDLHQQTMPLIINQSFIEFKLVWRLFWIISEQSPVVHNVLSSA